MFLRLKVWGVGAVSREVWAKGGEGGRWQSLASGKVKKSGVFREGVWEDVAGGGGVFLSLSALNCLTCFRHEESIS